MEVFLYQLAIASIIIISGFFGKKAKNISTITIAIFTLTHIFMMWLMVLQFATIIVSYFIASNITKNKIVKKRTEEKSSPIFTFLSGVFFIIASLLILRSAVALIGLFTGWYELTGWFTIEKNVWQYRV